MNKSSTINKNKGFSLIELSIVLIIMAVLIGLITFSVQTRMDAAKEALTKERMKLIMASIDAYYAQYGVIPCPALPVERTDANYGWSRNPVYDSNTPNIDEGSNSYSDWLYSNACEFGGDVPFKALGLDASVIADGWGNRFVYIAQPEYTIIENGVTNVNGPRDGYPANSLGHIYPAASGTPIDHIAYSLSSSGANQFGARADKTNKISTPPPFGSIKNSEFNLINTNINIENRDGLIQGFQNFGGLVVTGEDIDDIIMYKLKWALPRFVNCDLYKDNFAVYYMLTCDNYFYWSTW